MNAIDRPTVGASLVPAILGLSPWQSPLDAWKRLTGRAPEQPESAAMLRGNLLEPGLRDWYAREINAVVNRGPTLQEPGWRVSEHMHARPDGWRMADDGVVTVEIKTARCWDDWHDGVPVYYRAQVLSQMAAKHPDGLIIVASDVVGYVPDDFPKIYNMVRDDVRQAALVEKINRWYRDHVIADRAPPPRDDEERAALIAALTPKPDVLLDPTEDDAALVAQLAEGRRIEKRGKEMASEAATRLLFRVGGAGGIRNLVTGSRVAGRVTVDGKGLKKAHPDIYAQFARTGEPHRRWKIVNNESEDQEE